MFTGTWVRVGETGLTLSCRLAMLLFFLATGCAGSEPVGPGMPEEEVIQRLGQPDRKAVLVGKRLRELDDIGEADARGLRRVYVYEASGLQVWIKDGLVTGVTEKGVSTR